MRPVAKRTDKLLILLLCITLLASFITVNPSIVNASTTTTLSASADAYVRGGTFAANNYGTATLLEAKRDQNNDSYTRQSFFKFDISGISGNVTEAKLRVYAYLHNNDNTNVSIDAHGVSDSSWTEAGLTWNNAPTAGATVLDTATIVDTNPAWYEWDITSYIQSAGSGDVTIRLSGPVTTASITKIHSKEAATNQPELVITVQDSQPPSTPTNLASPAHSDSTVDLTWTASSDDVGVTEYEVYKDSVLEGTTASTNYTVSGLTPETAYSFTVKAKDAAGNASSESQSISVTTDAAPWYSKSTFSGAARSLGSGNAGSLDIEFDVTPLANNIDGVIGFVDTDTTITNYPDLSMIVRMYTDGEFDVRDGSSYTTLDPQNPVSYSANQTYHVLLSTDLSAQVYDVWVTPPGGSAIQIADDYAYRTNAPSIDDVGQIALYSLNTDDLFKVENFTIAQVATDTQAPTAPTNLASVSTTATSVDLTWSASTDDTGVTEYEIYKDGVLEATSSTTSYTVTGLTAETTYAFTVKAKDAAGNVSPASPSLSVTTDSTAWLSKNSFAAATHDLGTTNKGIIEIEYDVTPLANNIDGIVGYADTDTTVTGYGDLSTIVRMNTSGEFDARNGASYATSLATPLSYSANLTYHVKLDVNLDPQNQSYDVWVTPPGGTATLIADDFAFRENAPAINDIGKVVFYSLNADDQFQVANHSAAPAIVDTQAPTVPTSVAAVVNSGSSISLSWSASSDNVFVSGYKVYRDGVEAGDVSGTSFTDAGLSPLTQYSYTVAAYDPAGNLSAESSAVAATTTDTAPSAQRLGLFHTDVELTVWRDRVNNNGPYTVANDVSANSPGDWTRIANNKDTFMSDPDAGRHNPTWDTNISACVPNYNDEPAYTGTDFDPPLAPAGKLKDAAFYALIMNDTQVAQAVVNELVAQATTPSVDFSDTTRWCPGEVFDNHPYFMTAEWLTRLYMAFDYMRDDYMTAAQEATVQDWFVDAAGYLYPGPKASFDSRFADRDNGDYTPLVANDGTYTTLPYYGASVEIGHYGRIYTNRYGAIWQFIGLVGINENITLYKNQSKQWMKEYLMFGVYPDYFVSEFYRRQTDNPERGFAYAYSVNGYVWNMAEAFARIGDDELYTFETENGLFGSAGKPSDYSAAAYGGAANVPTQYDKKSIRYTIQLMGDYVNHSIVDRYATANSSQANDPLFIIDGYTAPNSSGQQAVKHVMEVYAAITNNYYDDDAIKDMYMRDTSAGYPAYYANPNTIGGTATEWEGTGGIFPGMLFMFGQMEDLVDPHPLP